MNLNIWDRNDLSTYFTGTYVGLLDDEGKVQPLYVDSVVETEEEHCSAIVGKVGSRSLVVPFTSEKLQVIVPDAKYINTSRFCLYVTRATSRQHKKGVRSTQFSVSNTSKAELTHFNKRSSSKINDENIWELFNSVYPKPDDALQLLANNIALSVAISPDFCVRLGIHSENPILCYKGFDCGEVTPENLFKLDREFYQLEEKLNEILGI